MISEISNYDTLVGLKLQSNGGYNWTDGSKFDSQSSFNPWMSPNNDPSGLPCVFIDSGSNKWDDTACGTKYRLSACKSCDGILNKYIILSSSGDLQTAQQAKCNTKYGTNLASIHSKNDMEEVTKLVNLSTIQANENRKYYIGLKATEIANEWTYDWTDGTSFDYGIESNMYPWYENQPNPTSQNRYALMDIYGDFTWKFEQNSAYSYICNMPSEICWSDQWTQIKHDENTTQAEFTSGCQYTTNKYQNETMYIMGNKKWDNGVDSLVVEYMFTSTYFTKYLNEKSNAGIIIYFDIECNTYFYIGIDIIDFM